MTTNKVRFNNFLIAFVFIDVLLLPNFKFFVMPISLPLILGLILMKKINIKSDKELIIFFLLTMLVLISTGLSLLQVPQYLSYMNIWMENIKRAFQFLTSFTYYFTLKNSLEKSTIDVKKILFLFIFIYIFLGILSIVNIGAYFNVITTLGVRNPFVNNFYVRNTEYLFRYSYIWIDPNNSAYAFQMVVFYLLQNEKLKPLEIIILYSSLFISLMLGMSTGALLSAAIFFTFFMFLQFKNILNYKTTHTKIWKNFILFGLGLVVVAVLVYSFRDVFRYIQEYSYERMIGNSDGGRLNKYSFMLSDKLPNLIGEGYTLVRNYWFFRPHSDHLRFLYSYGILAYLITLWFLFKKAFVNSKFLFVIPAFMAFSINSLIDEQKILIILLILLAYGQHINKKDAAKLNGGEVS